jgi:hypothetical protein
MIRELQDQVIFLNQNLVKFFDQNLETINKDLIKINHDLVTIKQDLVAFNQDLVTINQDIFEQCSLALTVLVFGGEL